MYSSYTSRTVEAPSAREFARIMVTQLRGVGLLGEWPVIPACARRCSGARARRRRCGFGKLPRWGNFTARRAHLPHSDLTSRANDAKSHSEQSVHLAHDANRSEWPLKKRKKGEQEKEGPISSPLICSAVVSCGAFFSLSVSLVGEQPPL